MARGPLLVLDERVIAALHFRPEPVTFGTQCLASPHAQMLSVDEDLGLARM
jgi:hypothetical protein